MAKLRVLFIGRTGVREIAGWYLADPARQVTDASLDAVMDKLAATWSTR
jgi:hypothetical protein